MKRWLVFSSLSLTLTITVGWIVWQHLSRPGAVAPAQTAMAPPATATTVKSTSPTPVRVAKPPVRPLPPLQAKLLGTAIGLHPKEAKAFVHDLSHNRYLTLAIGEAFQGRLLTNISRGFVRFRRPDRGEEILLIEDTHHPDAIIQAAGPDEYRVNRGGLKRAINGDVTSLLAETQVVPQLERFALAGFKLAHVKPKGLVAQAGFKDHDIVTAVNGTALDSLPTALAVYHAARNGREVSVEVMRHGQTRTLRYLLE